MNERMNEQAARQMNEQTVAGDLDMRSRWESERSQGMMQTACPEEREDCIVGPCDDGCSISIWLSPCLYLEQH